MLDKNPFEITDFKGVNKGSYNAYFGPESQGNVGFQEALSAKNLVFLKEGGIQTRPPLKLKKTLDYDTGIPDEGQAVQYWKIARLGNTYYDNRWLWLSWDVNLGIGRFYDTGIPGIVATITGCQYASVINIFGRLYISPLADFGSPLTGSDGVIWLYDGTTFRKAGGSAPTGGTLAITDTAVVGANVTAGLHIGAIAFESDSGYITPAGPTTRIQVTIAAGGGRAARFTNVDIGPAGTVARHLLLTKTIPTYDGIQDNWELFFALRIPDNVTTTGDVVLPDTGLVDSADYLLSEFSSIPACNTISSLGSRLVYNGSNTDARVIYVSKTADPETVDQTEDYIQIFEGIPEDIYNGAELRGLYYIFKETCTYVTSPDPSSPPNEWKVDIVDSGIGISPFGVGQVMANHGGLILDNLVVGGSAGLYIFSGSFQKIPLSHKIQAIFNNLTRDQAKYIRVCCDTIRKRLYIILGNNELWVGDYYRGLDPENIRWVKWTAFYTNEGVHEDTPIHIVVDPNNSNSDKPNITILFQNFIAEPDESNTGGGDSYKGNGPITWELETGFTSNPEISSLYTFAKLSLRIACLQVGGDTISIDLRRLDSIDPESTIDLLVPETPKICYTPLINLVAEQARVFLTGTKTIFIDKLILWASKRADQRPNGQ